MRRISLPGLTVIPPSSRPVPTTAPVNTVAPSITGIRTQGQTLAADPGSWTGLPSGVFTYQWQRGGVNISGATSSTYVAQAADVSAGASALTVEVTATNVVGPTTAESAGATIAAPLSLSGTPGTATVGSPYSFTPTTAGGHSAYSYALTGTLPAGLSLNTTTGEISGTPTTSGTASGLNITVTDSDGLTATLGTFSLVVSTAGAAITSLEIMGATPLLDATGDYGDADTRVGVNGNGWIAKVTVPYLVGQTFDPTKITINLSDPGYTASGTTTVTRTVRGGKIVRRQYNSHASLMQADNGVTLTVYFNLAADGAELATVFQGTTLVSANAASGYYGSSATGAITSLTNSSTVAYAKPLALWLQQHHLPVGSGGLYVELAAFSPYARNGRQVARVEFIGKDSQTTPNLAATQTASTPILSTLITKGFPPECYAATVPVTNLTQGDLCFVNAKVYPWIGDSSAVLDLIADGVGVTGNFATANPRTPLRFVNDKTGAWGGCHVAVKPGAGAGTAQSTRAGAEATPSGTIVQALAAMDAWNFANRGRHDTSGTIWLMDNSGVAYEHIVSSDLNSQSAGLALTVVRQSPSNTATASVVFTAAINGHPRISWHVDIRAAASTYCRGFGSYLAYHCDGTLDQNATIVGGSKGLWYQTFTIAYNLTQATSGCIDLSGTETGVQFLGYVNKVNASDIETRPHVAIGCDFEHIVLSEIATGTGNPASQDGKVIWNNKLMKLTGAAANGIGAGPAFANGFAIGQNVTERATGVTPAWSIGETNTTTQILNAIRTCNTNVGDRTNMLYCDVAGAAGVLKQMTSRFNLDKEPNTKDDVFSSLAGNHGNWKFRHGVDRFDGALKGDNNGQTVPGTGLWIGEYWSEPANTNLTIAAVDFVDDRSVNGTTAGGGDYRLTGASNPARNKIPAGMSPLAYYLDGTPRADDGTAPFGALPWVA